MTYQIAVNLGTSTCVKAGKATQEGENGPTSMQKGKDNSVPTVRISIRTPSYSAITYMQRT